MTNVQTVLEELTVLLDTFFQGLAECGLVSGYNVSLETSSEMLQPAERCLPLLLTLLCTLRNGIKELVLRHECEQHREWTEPVTGNHEKDIEEDDKELERLVPLNTPASPLQLIRSNSTDLSNELVIEENVRSQDCINHNELIEDLSTTQQEIETKKQPMTETYIRKTESSHVDTAYLPQQRTQEITLSDNVNVNEDKNITLESDNFHSSDTIVKKKNEFSTLNSSNTNEINNELLETSLKRVENLSLVKAVESDELMWEDKTLETLHSTNVTTFASGEWNQENDTKSEVIHTISQQENSSNEITTPAIQRENTSGLFQCPDCHREFKSSSNLETHRVKAHSAPQCCDMCGQVLGSTSALQEHCRVVHSGAGCFQCKICKRRFMLRLSFRRHLETHKPAAAMAVCEICGKSFRRADYLQRHYMMHSGQRPHICTVCGKAFVCASHLKNHHRAIHSSQRAHSCEMCGRGFSRADKLKEHMLRHMNIKRYSCDFCGREYAERRDLKKHQLRCQTT